MAPLLSIVFQKWRGEISISITERIFGQGFWKPGFRGRQKPEEARKSLDEKRGTGISSVDPDWGKALG
jgi:hypothetical protein